LILKKKKGQMENALLVFNRNPYDGTDVTWNGLRLVKQLINIGLSVNTFLMNDSVDLARDVTKQQEAKMTELAQWVKETDKVISF